VPARLEERGARIGDPAVRRSFFAEVPEHARTRALAAEPGDALTRGG
jgi:hypothetical protein